MGKQKQSWIVKHKTNLVVFINILAAISCIAIGFKFVFMPYFAKIIYADEYKSLMFQCDNVMRDHMIAKNRVLHDKNNESIKDLESAEMGLISCHNYDKIRKVMLQYGISSEELAYIGLEAIEENSDDLIKFVEIHEFKY